MNLRFTPIGWLYISPEDDCKTIVDAMLAINYDEEFCIAEGFDAEFTSRLMEAGFLVMSANIAATGKKAFYIMLPKLHLERSVLFFENLHVKKSVRRLLDCYELRADTEFDRIIDHCVERHGGNWLTPPLVKCIKKIRRFSVNRAALKSAMLENNALDKAALDSIFPEDTALKNADSDGRHELQPTLHAYPTAFALYRDGKLAAGEFGVVCGKVYTSYSGFYNENNAGTVQIILAARYLKEQGFSFFDLGMPLDYKTSLGAVDISPQEFVRLFRGKTSNGRDTR